MTLEIKFSRLAIGAIQPTYAHDTDAGMDLYCLDDVMLHHGVVVLVRTGIAIDIPEGWEGQVRPRSSLGMRGILIPNSPGTIDAGYRGEIKVEMMSQVYPIRLSSGDRIAQIVFAPVHQAHLIEVPQLPPGRGGWGSTGS